MLRAVYFIFSCSIFLTFYSANSALEPKRLALIIGNKNYQLSRYNLKNPHNDVDLVGRSLEKLGFRVKVVKDASLATIQRETKRYARRLRSAGKGAIGFFYYSGHGAMDESTRINYIIPVDISSSTTTELWDDSIRLKTITNTLKEQASNATHLVVFDACRSELQLHNPSTKTMGHTKGFAAVKSVRGMLISFATSEGKTATDLGTGSGHYARILSEELLKPGNEITTMFRNVQLKVAQSTGQEPWVQHNALPEVYLAGKQRLAATLPVPKPTLTPQTKFVHGYKFQDCKSCPKMIVVRGGSFMMGAEGDSSSEKERPLHRVAIKKFAVGQFEITNDEFVTFLNENRTNKTKHRLWLKTKKSERYSEIVIVKGQYYASGGKGLFPAINISWHGAKAYVDWLAKKTGKPYRLLSEAEWDYMSRGGKKEKFSWGETGDKNVFYSSGTDDAGGAEYRLSQNGYGIYNIDGNVMEWVEDCWHKNFVGAPVDGSAWLKTGGGDCSERVLTGGPWGGRTNSKPNHMDIIQYFLAGAPHYYGFRVARDVE